MTLLGILSKPQGSAYLPPTGSGTRPTTSGETGSHPDEWAGVSKYYFLFFPSRFVQVTRTKPRILTNYFNLPINLMELFQREPMEICLRIINEAKSRNDNGATGTFHLLLPDGRRQIVDYIADGAGYRPMVRNEGAAT
ncbi:PREDICTED: uncharacterized protein LOC108549128 [Eufriesea mexicana]|uniref:uncharacterized protein LOC108549128 n=1 Tax=Eufriesea mexicana TaxID=516756 RepID=UPI00083C360D|nr:PREDICTED: uncharacterized protein LOC108549128 [Eufriesea mexicana]